MEEKLQFKTFSEFTQIGDNMETTLKTISFHVIIFYQSPGWAKKHVHVGIACLFARTIHAT